MRDPEPSVPAPAVATVVKVAPTPEEAEQSGLGTAGTHSTPPDKGAADAA